MIYGKTEFLIKAPLISDLPFFRSMFPNVTSLAKLFKHREITLSSRNFSSCLILSLHKIFIKLNEKLLLWTQLTIDVVPFRSLDLVWQSNGCCTCSLALAAANFLEALNRSSFAFLLYYATHMHSQTRAFALIHTACTVLIWTPHMHFHTAAEGFTGLRLGLCDDLHPAPDGILTNHQDQFESCRVNKQSCSSKTGPLTNRGRRGEPGSSSITKCVVLWSYRSYLDKQWQQQSDNHSTILETAVDFWPFDIETLLNVAHASG